MTVNFETTSDDLGAITQICERAFVLAESLGVDVDRMGLFMDITAAHNTCPLKLDELLEADDATFAHDVWGIHRHIDRKTGELGDCFVPRLAA